METIVNTPAPEFPSASEMVLAENCPLQENRQERVLRGRRANKPKWQVVPLDSVVHVTNDRENRENRNPSGMRRGRRGSRGGRIRRRVNYIQPQGPEMTPVNYPDSGFYCPPANVQVPLFYGPLSPTQRSDLKRRIAWQIDYYFSEENFNKDPYLGRCLDKDGFCNLWQIKDFNHIKYMCPDMDLLTEEGILANSLCTSKRIPLKAQTATTIISWPFSWGPAMTSVNYYDSGFHCSSVGSPIFYGILSPD